SASESHRWQATGRRKCAALPSQESPLLRRSKPQVFFPKGELMALAPFDDHPAPAGVCEVARVKTVKETMAQALQQDLPKASKHRLASPGARGPFGLAHCLELGLPVARARSNWAYRLRRLEVIHPRGPPSPILRLSPRWERSVPGPECARRTQ